MMMDSTIVIAASCLFGICVVAYVMLRAWQDWIALKRQELERGKTNNSMAVEIEGGASVGAARIELADMKERIKKLEAIASGVEL